MTVCGFLLCLSCVLSLINCKQFFACVEEEEMEKNKSISPILLKKNQWWVCKHLKVTLELISNLISVSLTTIYLPALNNRFSVVIFLMFESEVCWPLRTGLPLALVRHGSRGSVMAPWSFPDNPCPWCTFPFWVSGCAEWGSTCQRSDWAAWCCHISLLPWPGRQM